MVVFGIFKYLLKIISGHTVNVRYVLSDLYHGDCFLEENTDMSTT
jgi:hypothetical protein